MARNPGGKQTPPAPPQDGRADFELTGDHLTEFRAAMARDDAGEGDAGGKSPVELFWEAAGRQLGFDPETLVLSELPEDGPVKFTAIPAEPTAAQPPAAPASDDDDDADDQDAEAAQSRGLQLMEQAASSMQLASSTLAGDVTAGLLNIVQNLQKPWGAHSQHEKRDLVAKLEHLAQIVLRKATDIIAADDRVTVKAILDKITIGDKVQINLTLGAMADDDKAEAVAQLFHAQKKSVLIVTADADRHMGKRAEHVAADEEELPFDAGTDKPVAEREGDAAAQDALDAGSPAGDAEALGQVVEERVEDALETRDT